MATTDKTTSRKRTEETSEGFTAEERAAMKERAKEVRAAKKDADPLAELLEKIASLPDADRAMAERLHAIVQDVAPGLTPRTYYGMPAYAKDGRVLLFFQPASKFKSRYATLGFNDDAQLDDGAMWPTSYALAEVGAAEEKQIRELVKLAVG